MEQVIQINVDGSIEGLLHKPGKGVDLRQFGNARVARVSEVCWSEAHQKWYIEFRVGKYAGRRISQFMYATAMRHPIGLLTGDPCMFAEYEDAVAAEIAVCNHIRLTENGAFDF